MPPAIHKVHRQLDLIALFVSRHYPLSRGQIWDEVEGYRVPLQNSDNEASVRRMFERDKKDLLELGFPLEVEEDPRAEPDEQHRYRLSHRDFYLPYLRLIREGAQLEPRPKSSTTPPASLPPEDAWRLAEALHTYRRNPGLPHAGAAESAFRKLTFDLASPDSDFGSASVILSSDDDAARERVERLSEAVRRRRRARFAYHSIGRDEVANRRVEPRALLFKFNRWYLIAHDLDRDARRIFRVSRMSGLEVDDEAGAWSPVALDLSEWTAADAWNLPGDEEGETTVDVRMAFPRSLWADRNERGALVDSLPGGATVRRFTVRSMDPFLRWLLSFGREVEVAAPESVARALGELRARVAELHGDTGGAA
ncbi:WYL domain-containing protein [Gemmatimonadota bacterium Y43]|uniref:helix-turn-helix transcriptional regulator n=1 Tax=Gaopeijia maritima TaxID=3119007 RepID=UPI003288B40B